ncbi:MAG: Maf family protein [Legionellales bacterium]|nr:Maf family protein [Legionellales bacterium]
MKIYLASKSPRRQELLRQMEIPFELLSIDIPEIVAPDESSEAYSQRITQEKLFAAWGAIVQKNLPVLPVLCADTEVMLDGDILGKPQDKQDAFHMLKKLSGRTHHVITSVGLVYHDYQKVVMNKTVVTFAAMTDAEINHYLAMGSYQDKAGGYGIQSYIGQYISRIEGCFYSVMGLPLNDVRELFQGLNQYRNPLGTSS